MLVVRDGTHSHKGEHADLVRQTRQWLDALDVDTDLNVLCEEIVRRIVALRE